MDIIKFDSYEIIVFEPDSRKVIKLDNVDYLSVVRPLFDTICLKFDTVHLYGISGDKIREIDYVSREHDVCLDDLEEYEDYYGFDLDCTLTDEIEDDSFGIYPLTIDV